MRFKSDTIYYLVPYGLGDALAVCSYFDAIKASGSNICLLLKRTHEFVAAHCRISDYAAIDTADDVNLFINQHRQYVSAYPRPGYVYVAHPFYNNPALSDRLRTCSIDFNSFYQSYFNSENRMFFKEIDLAEFKLPDGLRKEIEGRAGCSFGNIVFCITETRSIKEFHDAGYIDRMVAYAQRLNPACKVLADKDLDVSLAELISIAARSKKVYANKSGICDILAGLGDRLTVVFPNDKLLYVYSAKKMFESCQINEILMDQVV